MERTLLKSGIKLDAKIFFDAPNMRAYTEKDANGNEVRYIRGTGSSTAKDFYGSTITAEAQVKMLNKLRALSDKMGNENSGLTAFLNHRYKIPEDTLGAFVSAQLSTRMSDGVDGVAGGEKGENYIDLDILCRVTSANPRAMQAWEQVNDGIRHGWSIGAYFLAGEWASDDPGSDEFWDMNITDIELLEISLVGIPANQRCWVREKADLSVDAVKAAEKIARDAKLKSRVRGLAPDRLRSIRGLAVRSIVKHDDDARLEARGLAYEFRRIADGTDEELDEAQLTEVREALAKAADMLEKRADQDDPTSPDDQNVLITAAIGHMAKAVGHGLCMRSAGHIGKALNCMSAIIGADGGTVEPGGDEDPNEMAAALAELRKIYSDDVTLIAEKKGEGTEFTDVSAEIAQAIAGVLRVADTNTTSPIMRAFGDGAGVELCKTDTLEARLLEIGGKFYVVEKSGDAIAVRESADDKKPYGNVEYADPGYQPDGVHRYPLDTVEHIKAAASYFGQTKNRDKYTSSQQKAIESRIAAAEKRHGIGEQKSIDANDLDTNAASPIMRKPESASEFKALVGEMLKAGLMTTDELRAAFAFDQIGTSNADLADIDGKVVTATAELDRITADTTARTAELEVLKTSIDVATKAVNELEEARAKLLNERVGRVADAKALVAMLAARGASGHDGAYTPERAYAMSPAERDEALKRQMSGNTTPAAGRDLAI